MPSQRASGHTGAAAGCSQPRRAEQDWDAPRPAPHWAGPHCAVQRSERRRERRSFRRSGSSSTSPYARASVRARSARTTLTAVRLRGRRTGAGRRVLGKREALWRRGRPKARPPAADSQRRLASPSARRPSSSPIPPLPQSGPRVDPQRTSASPVESLVVASSSSTGRRPLDPAPGGRTCRLTP